MTVYSRRAKKERKRHAVGVVFSSAFPTKPDPEATLIDLDQAIGPAFEDLFNAALVTLILDATEDACKNIKASPVLAQPIQVDVIESEAPGIEPLEGSDYIAPFLRLYS